jgi:hypothetical protein
MDLALHQIPTLKMALQPPPLPRKITQGFFKSVSGNNEDRRQAFPHFIRYVIEWKVEVNNRFRSEDTEQDIALTPSAY